MTKKDFIVVAACFEHEVYGWLQNEDGKKQSEYIAIKELAETMASAFIKGNPRFDRAKFMKACGFEN